MSRVLALDLDDTLLRSDGSVSSRTLELLAAWQEAGNRTVVATGRPPRAIPESLPDPLMAVPWVCYNGAEIRHNGDVIFQDLIEPQDTRHIVGLIDRHAPDVQAGLEIDGLLYMNRPLNRFRECEIVDLTTVCERPSAKVLLFYPDMDKLAPVLDDVPKSVRVMLSNRYNLVQMLSCTVDKAHALQRLVSDWGLTMQDVIAIGDDVNDVGMVEASGLGVAVENAVPEVKAVADHVTASNDDDGVARLLEYLLNGDV